MTAVHPLLGAGGEAPVPRPVLLKWWLGLSAPIATIGIATSLAGILVDRIYRHETVSWRAEAIGQDVANLVVLSALAVFAVAATRGSVGAFLAWLGTVVYTAYTFAIYVFAVHFGPLFLLYVAVFAMAVWALVGALTGIDATRVRDAFVTTPLGRFVPWVLIGVAAMFALLWLSEDLPAVFSASPSDSLTESGLLTNPVHVLDLSLFLPTAVVAGLLLRRGRPWGHVLVPVVLVAMAAIGSGIVSLTLVSLARGLDGSLVLAAVIGAMAAVQAWWAWRFLTGLAPGARLPDVLR